MSEESEEARRAAEEATRPDRLLPGEAGADDASLEDARHWKAVYAELVESKRSILGVTVEQLRASSGREAAAELNLDRSVLRQELDRLQNRLRYWSDRESDLSSAPA
jgi:hypothetical protein